MICLLGYDVWCRYSCLWWTSCFLLQGTEWRQLSCYRWNCISSHHTVIVLSALGCSLLFCILLCLSFPVTKLVLSSWSPVEITKLIPSSWNLITCLTNERTRAERTEWQKDVPIWFTSFTLLTLNTALIYVTLQGRASTADTPKLSQTGNRLVRKMVYGAIVLQRIGRLWALGLVRGSEAWRTWLITLPVWEYYKIRK
jgi:hypothetical protein